MNIYYSTKTRLISRAYELDFGFPDFADSIPLRPIQGDFSD